MRILLVEPEGNHPQLRTELAASNFNVNCASDADNALWFARTYTFDAIIFMRVATTVAHMRAVRDVARKTAIIVISASGNVRDIAAALNAGADDYMVAPIAFEELVARLHAIVRRHNEHYDDIIEIGKLKVDLANHITWIDGKLIHLPRKPQQILEILARRKGKLVPRETLFDLLYGAGLREPEAKILDVFMCRLRKDLSRASDGGRYIRCEWSRGYIIDDPAAHAAAKRKEYHGRGQAAACA